MAARLHSLGPDGAGLASRLHREVFLEEGWSEADWGALLEVPGAFGWLLFAEEETPAGFLLARHGGGEAEILTLGVLTGFRRRGHALLLLRAFLERLAVEEVAVAYLEVAESNSAAASLYRSLDFKPVGRREDYYKRKNGRESALVFRWSKQSQIR